jgi:hypothetical protein
VETEFLRTEMTININGHSHQINIHTSLSYSKVRRIINFGIAIVLAIVTTPLLLYGTIITSNMNSFTAYGLVPPHPLIRPEATTNLSTSIEASFTPRLAVSGNNVYVAWIGGSLNQSLSGNSTIFFKRSVDGGATFENTMNLSGAKYLGSISIDAVGNNVYVVWYSTSTTQQGNAIFFKRSVDGGATFGNTMNLSTTTNSFVSPSMAASGNNVYVVWYDQTLGSRPDESRLPRETLVLEKSMDGGASFSRSSIFLNSSFPNINSTLFSDPKISAFENNVYVVWYERGNHIICPFVPPCFSQPYSGIFLSKSTDNGGTFGRPHNIADLTNDNNTKFSSGINVHLASYGNNVYLIWNRFWIQSAMVFPPPPREVFEIFFKRSVDGGATFGNTETVNPSAGYLPQVDMAAFGNRVYVVMREEILAGPFKGNSALSLITGSTDQVQWSGELFGLPRMTFTSEDFDPHIALSENNAYMIWRHVSNDKPNSSYILFQRVD